MTSAINISGFNKTYRGSWGKPAKVAVTELSLAVEQGEVFGFIGANGAGKSTTIKALTGALRPTSGRAELFGTPVEQPSARLGLGYVPENPSLYDYLTPLELLRMGLRLHSVTVDNERQHCMNWLERFGLADVATKRIAGFSKGMVQRATLAHALVIKPRLLILDEPLSGLDPIGRRDVVDLLSEYKKSGGTIFFTSHVLHDVERLADRFGLIHKGVLKAVRSPSEFVEGEERLVVRSLGASPVEGMHDDSCGRWYAEVLRSDLWSMLQALQAAKHEIIEIKPSLSLESAFLSVVRSDEGR